MTVGFFPAFEPRLAVTYEGDGASLFHHAAILDALAEENGFPLLSSFTDEREPPPDFDGYPEELADAIGPWNEWFSPEDGLRCVEDRKFLGGEFAVGNKRRAQQARESFVGE